MKTLPISFAVHMALLLVIGCSVRPSTSAVPLADLQGAVAAGKAYVQGIDKVMPTWDADGLSHYERTELATVKADIAMAYQADNTTDFLIWVAKLHKDWDALVALDEMLQRSNLT